MFDKLKSLFNKKKKKQNSHYYVGIVVNEKSLNEEFEGYNRLRDNLLYLNSDGKTKVIQIESSVSHEGKTTVACNLAVTMGLANKKVAIVDLDFRKANVNRNMGVSNETGIAEYILGKTDYNGVIKHTKYKNVDVITRGARISNSTVVLLSEKFKELIGKLRDDYDYVILDCAPVMLVSDHIHISQVSDGILFIVAYGLTTKAQVADSYQILKRNNAKILGTCFSMFDKKKSIDYRRYYGYGYRRHHYYYAKYTDRYTEEKGSKPTEKQD